MKQRHGSKQDLQEVHGTYASALTRQHSIRGKDAGERTASHQGLRERRLDAQRRAVPPKRPGVQQCEAEHRQVRDHRARPRPKHHCI